MNKQARKSNRKKLFYISAHFPPCGASGVYRTLGFLEFLVPLGWSVRVLAIKNIREERNDPKLLQQIPHGVKVIRTGYIDLFSLKPQRTGQKKISGAGTTKNDRPSSVRVDSVFSRIRESISYLLKTPDSYPGWIPVGLLRAVASTRPDVILATAPPFSSLILGVLLKKIWRRPLVIDLRDPWCHNPFRLQRPAMADSFDRFLERWVFRHADHVLMNTEEACRLYQEQYPAYQEKISVLTNGFSPVIKRQTLAADKKYFDGPWIVHVGALYGKRSPKELIAASRGMHGIIIDLYGPGTQQYHDAARGTPVRLHPPVPHERAIILQQQADITLVIGNCMNGSVQIPAKIYEAMAVAGQLWLIDTDDSPTGKLLLNHGIPHFFSCNRADSIKVTLQKIKNDYRNSPLPAGIDASLTAPFQRARLTRELDNILAALMPYSEV